MGKKDGVVYTPEPVVEKMLDMMGYLPDIYPQVLSRHIIDNSCGNGNILLPVLKRYVEAADVIYENLGYTPFDKRMAIIKKACEHIHGIEIDEKACEECKARMDQYLMDFFDVEWVNTDWDIRCQDALDLKERDIRVYDYVIGNPPYIRVHDLECDLSGYEFTEEGMKDIYIAFYELSLKMVKEGGKICYITPSSWFTSKAGEKLRKYLYNNKLLSYVADYGHTQVFDGVTTYVEITMIDTCKPELYNYVTYEDMNTGKKMAIPYPSFESDGKFYFMEPQELLTFTQMQLSKEKAMAVVKNGFATLADKIFIHDEKMDDSPYVIPVVKSSTGKKSWCIYPYNEEGKLVDEWDFARSAPTARDYLTDNKGKLLDRDTDEPYYAFGRTQAIGDTYKTKYAIKNIVKTVDDLKPIKVEPGTGVYGGLYIQCDYPLFIDSLNWETFLKYVKSLKKYKSGGYYTYSSKDLQKFLDWSWENRPKELSYLKDNG